MLQRTAYVLIAGTLLLAGCVRSPQSVRNRAVANGKTLMNKRDYRRAILEFKNAVQAVPRDSEAQLELGNAYAAAGDVVAAAAAFKAATDLDPKNAAATRNLAQLMVLLGDRSLVEDAERRLRAVLDTSPADITALNTLAFAELKLGKQREAIRHLQEVLARSPRQIVSAVLLAHARLMENDVNGAEKDLKSSVVQNPESPDALVVLGRFHSGTGRLAEAEQDFRKALQIQPGHAPALFYLGMLENSQGQKDRAELRFRTLSTHPQKAYWPVYGMFLLQEGRTADAIHEFERIYRADPNDRAARTRLVAVYRASNRPQDGEKLVGDALAKNPKDIDALLQRCDFRLERGLYAQAQTDINQVLHENPSMPEAHYLQARIYEKNGLILSERQQLNEALQSNPLFLPARIALARLLAATNAEKTALDLLEETPVEQKASLAVLVQRNWIFAQTGDLKTMQHGVEQGLAVQRTPDLLIQYALVMLGERNREGARALAEEALKAAPGDMRALEVLAKSYAPQDAAAAAVRLRQYAADQRGGPSVHLFLGKWLQAQGDLAGARTAIARAKAVGGNAIDIDIASSQLDLIESKWQKARETLQKVLARNSDNITAKYWLAQVEEIQGNHKASIEMYRSVLAADPTNATALSNLAVLLTEYGQPSEALALAQRAKELLPENPAIADTLGWVLYNNGLYSLAIPELEQANARQPSAMRASHLSMAYWKAGSAERARRTLANALRLDASLPEVKQARALIPDADRKVNR